MRNVPPPELSETTVVLVHGLFMGRPAMQILAKRLRLAGVPVRCFAYNTITGGLDHNARRLVRMVRQISGPAVLVGHSLGGLVSLKALSLMEEGKVSGVALLASPVQGARAGALLRRLTGGQHARIARSLHDWADRPLTQLPAVPVLALAGTRSSGLGRVVLRFDEPNDGTVALSETVLPGAQHEVLPVSHTGILFDAQVVERLVAWLRQLSLSSEA